MLCRLLFLHSRWANCLIRSPGQMCLFYVKITYSYHVSSMKIHRKGLLPYISYIGMRPPQRVHMITSLTQLNLLMSHPHVNAFAAKSNPLTFNLIIHLLLTSLAILFPPTKHQFLHVDLHSVPHHDTLTGRKFQLTSTIFLDACDLLNIFLTTTATLRTLTKTTLLSTTKVLGTPPTTENEHLTPF